MDEFDVLQRVFEGLERKERELLWLLSFKMLEKILELDIANYDSVIKVINRMPDMFNSIYYSEGGDMIELKQKMTEIMKIVDKYRN